MAVKLNPHCLSFWSFLQRICKDRTFHCERIESGGKITLWNKCFLQNTLSAPYRIFYE